MPSLERFVAPTTEPVTLDQAKAHCRVDNDAEDDLIRLYISAAREYAEKRLNRSLLTQVWSLTSDTFPCIGYRHLPGFSQRCYSQPWTEGMTILLPKPPTVSVIAVLYTDYTGMQTILQPSSYAVDVTSEPARITPVAGSYWPILVGYPPGAVQVIYTAGYGDDASTIPANIILAILMLVGHFYSNREATSQAQAVTSVPLAVDALLGSYAFTQFTYEA